MDDMLTKYRDTIKNPPKSGTLLTTIDGEPAALTVQLVKGKPPFIYGCAYVSEILDEKLGWYLRGANSGNSTGWKCILMAKARREIVKHFNDLVDGQILVTSLRVLRRSESGQSLLCEVAEYHGSSES
jgi:hypothetical protein